MLKKSLIALSAFILIGCSSHNTHNPQEPLYKISDEDMKKIILLQNNGEQCIFPQLKGLSYAEADRQVYQKLSEAEEYVFAGFLDEQVRSVVGEKNFATLAKDQPSLNYFNEQLNKFNNQNANVNEAECKVFKNKYYTELKLVQDKIQNARSMCKDYTPTKSDKSKKENKSKKPNKSNKHK